jgi:hypothetical protein
MTSTRIDRILSLIDSVLDSEPEPTAQVVMQRIDGSRVVVPFRTNDRLANDYRPAA